MIFLTYPVYHSNKHVLLTFVSACRISRHLTSQKVTQLSFRVHINGLLCLSNNYCWNFYCTLIIKVSHMKASKFDYRPFCSIANSFAAILYQVNLFVYHYFVCQCSLLDCFVFLTSSSFVL